MSLKILASRAQALQSALVAHARLSLLALLGEAPLAAQRDRARAASQRLEQATRLEELLGRHLQLRPRKVAWPTALRPDTAGLLEGESVSVPRVAALLESLARAAGQLACEALAAAQASELLEPLAPELAATLATLPVGDTSITFTPPAADELPRAPVQALRGPLRVGQDPIFEPSFSLLDPAALQAMGSHRAPHSWCLSTREAMAAELCALSAVEYDGLPLAYYRDLAKQCWDEVRHARLFLDIGLEALPDFLAHAPEGHPLLPGARRFVAEGRGLPVAAEGNLYEMIWNCSLEQRLVLMHVDTETPGVGGFVRELRSAYCRARPELAERLRVAMHDEASHARFGRRWLAHLIADDTEREARSNQARLLRGVLLLSGLARHQEKPLFQLIEEARSGAPPR